MDFENLASLISTFGFPVVCCVFMWKYISTTLKEFSSIISENTKMISRLCDKLDVINVYGKIMKGEDEHE